MLDSPTRARSSRGVEVLGVRGTRDIPTTTEAVLSYYFLNKFVRAPRNSLPTLRSTPCLVIGIPVVRDIFCFTFVMPTARFQENVTPGIFMPIDFDCSTFRFAPIEHTQMDSLAPFSAPLLAKERWPPQGFPIEQRL